MPQEQNFADADFGYDGGEDFSPILMGWNTTEDPYICCICKREHPRLRGPAFFVVREDKKLEPVCFDCVANKAGKVITSDKDVRVSLLGLRMLFTLAKSIRTSRCGDMTLNQLMLRFARLAWTMTGEPEQG